MLWHWLPPSVNLTAIPIVRVRHDALLKVEPLQLRMLGGYMHTDGVLALEDGPAPRALKPHPCSDMCVLHMHPEPI